MAVVEQVSADEAVARWRQVVAAAVAARQDALAVVTRLDELTDRIEGLRSAKLCGTLDTATGLVNLGIARVHVRGVATFLASLVDDAEGQAATWGR